jgi:hypothetical protein
MWCLIHFYDGFVVSVVGCCKVRCRLIEGSVLRTQSQRKRQVGSLRPVSNSLRICFLIACPFVSDSTKLGFGPIHFILDEKFHFESKVRVRR